MEAAVLIVLPHIAIASTNNKNTNQKRQEQVL